MAKGRAGRDTAETAEERAERGSAGGGKEALGVYEPAEEVRRGLVPLCECSGLKNVLRCFYLKYA